MLVSLLPLILFAQIGDDLAVVKADPSGGSKMELWVHTPLGPQTAPTAYASDVTFYKSSGKRPARFVFGADIDGDEVDEVVVLKEELDRGGRYRLYVRRAPKVLDGSVGKVLASTAKKALGDAVSHGEIIAMCAIDVNADGIDEVAMIRQVSDGGQRLEVLALPTGKKQPLDAPLGSYLEFGDELTDSVRSIDGIDIDADGAEELLVHRQSQFAPEWIHVDRPPLVIDDVHADSLIRAIAPTFPLGDILAVRSFDLDSNGVDEIGLIRGTQFGVNRVTIHLLPTGALFGGPKADQFISNGSSNSELHSVFVLRGFASKGNQEPFDPAVLTGEFSITMSHSEVVGYSNSENVTLGPTTGIGTLDPQNGWGFELDQENGLDGDFDWFAMKIGIGNAPVKVDGKGGDKLTLVFQPSSVLWLGSKVALVGAYHGSGKTAQGDSFSVVGGKYQFLRSVE